MSSLEPCQGYDHLSIAFPSSACASLASTASHDSILNGLKRFSEIYNESVKIKKCNHNNACFKIQPKKYEKLLMDKISSNDSVLLINAHLPSEAIKSDNPKENNIIKVRPLDCLNIFKRITDEDIRF